MLAIDDIRLIREQLIKIKRSSYFDKPLLDHTVALIELAEYVDANSSTIAPPILMGLRKLLFSDQMFLGGTTSSEVPFEVVYSLKHALNDWGHANDLITTALLDDHNFYFLPSNGVWKFVQTILPGFRLPAQQYALIQIAFPRLYKSKPLLAIPLYHELGHFIDITNKISERVLLGMFPPGSLTADQRSVRLNHLREHFADLFSSCYCGDVLCKILPNYAGMQPASYTHPSIADRIAIINTFISGSKNDLVDRFQAALAQMKMPALSVRFKVPDANRYLDNMRPILLTSKDEIHGIYVAGYEYLESQRAKPTGNWVGLHEFEIVRIVNDLIEKSIRNHDVTEKWAIGSA